MQSAHPPFPFQQILSMAIQVPRQHMVSLFKLGWPFLIIMIAFYSPEFQNQLDLFSQRAANKEAQPESIQITPAALTGALLATLLIANMAMLTYRKILLNTQSSWFDAFKLKARLAPFLIKGLQVSLALFVLSIFSGLVFSPIMTKLIEMNLAWLAQFIIAIPVYYFLCRFMLILPAAALENLQGLSWSLSISKPYALPILVLNGVIPLAAQLVLNLIPVFDLWVISIFLAITAVLVSVIQLALAAYTYQFLMDCNDATPNQTDTN